MHVQDHPGSAEILVDKNIAKVAGRYINGIVSKRFHDKNIHAFNKVGALLAGSVRDYDINYLNGLRGVRGFREDMGLVNFWNDLMKTVGSTHPHAHDHLSRGR